MKKADILVIALILILSVGFYAIYFSNNLIINDDSTYKIEIYYKNELIYNVELTEDINERVNIITKNNELFVNIDSDGDGNYDDILGPNTVNDNREILNTVKIEYGHVHMEDANCANKLCLNMKIGRTLSTPIFCTNDILVKLVTEEYNIITG